MVCHLSMLSGAITLIQITNLKSKENYIYGNRIL